jgi:hypothetical protein
MPAWGTEKNNDSTSNKERVLKEKMDKFGNTGGIVSGDGRVIVPLERMYYVPHLIFKTYV